MRLLGRTHVSKGWSLKSLPPGLPVELRDHALELRRLGLLFNDETITQTSRRLFLNKACFSRQLSSQRRPSWGGFDKRLYDLAVQEVGSENVGISLQQLWKLANAATAVWDQRSRDRKDSPAEGQVLLCTRCQAELSGSSTGNGSADEVTSLPVHQQRGDRQAHKPKLSNAAQATVTLATDRYDSGDLEGALAALIDGPAMMPPHDSAAAIDCFHVCGRADLAHTLELAYGRDHSHMEVMELTRALLRQGRAGDAEVALDSALSVLPSFEKKHELFP